MKLIAIKTDGGYFISDDLMGNGWSSEIHTLRFDGEMGKPSFHKPWVFIPSIPSLVEKKVSSINTNFRYVLKPAFPVTDSTPSVIYERYLDEDSGYQDVAGLYDFVSDVTPESWEKIDVSISVIDSTDNFKFVRVDHAIEQSLLDKMMFHPVMLPLRPCKMTVDETYKMIRGWIKTHINLMYAKITSDYDFCFTVEKRIPLTEDEAYTVDVNAFSLKKRKPRYETRYRTHRDFVIYEIAPKKYQHYPVVEPFEGNSYEDMMEKAQTFLDNLMDKINEPVIDCPHCKGRGVILESEK